ncbi:serine hydrolase [Flavivirga sp. Y03]|uniref:Serine hydrolase n=2 Tax=Flavivirga algicola TaxID=2729136 RepID=A0ABX1RTY2_9FLAO|nr:serine hydrolase [Flavivirga algicola]
MALIFISCQHNNELNKNQKEFKKKHPLFSSQFENQIKNIYKEKALFGDFMFAVVDENGLAYSFTLNRDILEGNKTSLTNNSPIYIASHTKSFTGTLLKILEEKGELDLNHSLAHYLPELNYSDSVDTKTINLKSLLNHTHGTMSLPLIWKTAFIGYSGEDAELVNDLNTDFRYDPSHKFRYSNVGPIIAGLVVDEVTGNTWKDEMKRYIFEPLKMNNTSTYVTDFDFNEIRPSVTATKEIGIIETGFYKKDITMHASGGIISTLNDLSKWLNVNMKQDEILLSKNSWADLHTSTTEQDREYFTYKRIGYSLGWDIAKYQNNTILTRFGGLAGISFHISFLPNKNIGIIAFSTDSRANILPHLMANYAYNQLNSLPADSIFKEEKKKFSEVFEKKNKKLDFNASDILENDPSHSILGVYQNKLGWPKISITKKDNYYIFNWGVLNGKIYKTEKGKLLTRLGVLNRTFEIKNDSLLTGSLIYIKVKE